RVSFDSDPSNWRRGHLTGTGIVKNVKKTKDAGTTPLFVLNGRRAEPRARGSAVKKKEKFAVPLSFIFFTFFTIPLPVKSPDASDENAGICIRVRSEFADSSSVHFSESSAQARS